MRTLADLVSHLNLAENRALPRLVLLSDDRRLPDPTAASDCLPSGSMLILRSYAHPERAALAYRLAEICRRRRVIFLVAGDWKLALATGAGLHVPEGLWRLSPAVRLWHRKRGKLLTFAAHGRRALARAASQGADAALLSPVFPTASHPGQPCLGAIRFRRLAKASRLPVYALGGITVKTAPGLQHSGAAGLATVGGLKQA